MPNRILREGILTSPKMARIGWAEEVFYRRLMSAVDDYGRYFANQSVLRGHLYPRQIDKVSDSDVGKWLRACVAADLVRVYPAQDGESYLEIVKFDQQVRAKKSKYPDPLSIDSNCNQAPSNAHLDVFGDVDEGDNARKRAPPRVKVERPESVDPQVWDDWLTLRKQKRAPVTPTVLAGAITEAAKAGLTLDAFLRVWCRRGSQGLEADWLKPDERGRPQQATTVAHNPQVDATQRLLRDQAEHARQATPPPAEILALRSRRASA